MVRMIRMIRLIGLIRAAAIVVGLGLGMASVAIAQQAEPVRGPALDAGSLPIAASSAPAAPRAVPGKLVVRYHDHVDACAHCLLAHGRAFASVTGSDSLDHLNERLGVHAAHALFFERHGLDAARARSAFAARIAGIQSRFPARAMRADASRVPELTGIYEVDIAEDVDLEEAARLYAADRDVVYANPVYVVEADLVPNDPYFSSGGTWGQLYGDLWGLHMIGAAAAWDVATGTGTRIAVVDTGVDASHSDLAANMWTNPGEIAANGIDDDANGYVDDTAGWNFDDDSNDVTDRYGHGTHVAGIAAAVGGNALGVVGAAFDARIMNVKGLGDDGSGLTTRLAQAIFYAAANGADVINNSWGGFNLSEEVYDAIDAADALGAVVVSASGNEGQEINSMLWLPAMHPRGLTVGALAPDGSLASFSNWGFRQSVAAPGVDVLSLRSAKNVFDNGLDVGSAYLRLSGTSMATPHVSAVAALVLAADPTLTPAEVRWRIELGADQPGSPGYEGELHNPYFGYGSLDAANAFGVPPITTRLDAPRVTEWHAFAEPTAIPGEPATFLFTTLAPVAWAIDAPAWLAPASPTGSGAASLDFAIAGGAVGPGDYAGTVVLDAPVAVDGGASFDTRLHVHTETRAGAPIPVGAEGYGALVGYEPAGASNGISSLLTWASYEVGALGQAFSLLSTGGKVTGPTHVTDYLNVRDVAVTSDGHDFLIAWRDFWGHEEGIHFVRVGADGTLLNAGSVPAVSRKDSSCRAPILSGAGFDGTDYWLAYADEKFCGRSSAKLYAVRVHPDGSFAKPARVHKLKSSIYGRFTCRTGSCLWAWLDSQVEGVEPGTGKYIRSVYALGIADGEPMGDVHKVATDFNFLGGLAAHGDQYLAIGQRIDFCGPGDLCRTDALAMRAGVDGTPLDPEPIVVGNVSPVELVFPWPSAVTHDGSTWVVSCGIAATNDSVFEDGSYVLFNRIDDQGTALSTEYVGNLVDSTGRASRSVAIATATDTVIAWEDGRDDPAQGDFDGPKFSGLLAQPVLARASDARYPDVTIGSIGPLQLAEREPIRFRVGAVGLDPATTEFSATNLPAGAVFDADSRLFQWRPDGTQAGTYAGVVFTASDGGPIVSESVDLVVSESISSLVGRVSLPNGDPAPGVGLDVRGTLDRSRTIYTDALGRYAIENVPAGRKLRLRLAKHSRKRFLLAPKSLTLVSQAGDVTAPDLTATPR